MNDARRAIEALRAGVPNRAAIRLLGTTENEIVELFEQNLAFCRQRLKYGEQATGQVFQGEFGTGKSHLLGYLQELALAQNFVVSRVVISKETPLSDPSKLYVAAFRNATVPHRNDDALTAVLSKLPPRGSAYDDLVEWTESTEAELSPFFAALLHLFPHAQTGPDRIQRIARFLSGGKLGFAHVKQWLKAVGAVKLFPFKSIKQAELMRQRIRFVPRLIAAAGYSEWVLLLDEIELLGRYSVLQRGRGYAELARWLGLDAAEPIPGVVTVAAMSEDFVDVVINGRRDDEQVPLKLANKNERKTAERARLGMDALSKNHVLLQRPTAFRLEALESKLRDCYSEAYQCSTSPAEVGELTTSNSMRQYIKSWITIWDHERLYNIRPSIELSKVESDLAENKDIEAGTSANDDDLDDE